jgi:hypothetical protein
MANTSTYLPGNRFERIQSPPYFQPNNKPFWPSLNWSATLTLAAAEPLHITRPIVEPEMVPTLFFDGEPEGLVINAISVRYTGAQDSVNTLFIYDLFNFKFYCIGTIPLPIAADYSWPPEGDAFAQGDLGTMLHPNLLLGESAPQTGLRLMESESIYLGIAQELTSPIVVSAWGQRYSKLEKIAASIGAEV